MSQSILSFSSQLTGSLLAFRNPHGLEENWVFQNNLPTYNKCGLAARIAVVEVGAILLIPAAAIEAVVIGILFIPAAGVSFLWEMRQLTVLRENLSERFDSCVFTIYWNICNIFLLNISLINSPTHESYVRYVLDSESEIGRRTRIALGAVATLVTFVLIITRSPVDYSSKIFEFARSNHMREKDRVYMGLLRQTIINRLHLENLNAENPRSALFGDEIR